MEAALRDDVDPQVLRDSLAPALLNNPGGIRHSPAPWDGKSDVQVDPQFVTFDSPQLGIRAMGVNLRTYRDDHGIKTIERIIPRWAPATENRTEAYIRDVVRRTGFRRDEEVDVTDPATLRKLVDAIIVQENGINPYRPEVITDALRDAAAHRHP